jgi:purine-nucleoside phosphorylase
MDPDTVTAAHEHVAERTDTAPETALILGSGLGHLADRIEDPDHIPYDNVPGLAASSVEGHAGRFVTGRLEGREVIAMQGRVHYYETGDMDPVGLPVRIMHRLGAEEMIVTNAAGGIADRLEPGDLMLLSDHLNMMPSPLIGGHDDSFGPRFPDMTEPYSTELRETAQEVSDADLAEGVYAAMTGPNYETPAEVKMLETLGADAAGMSTVPETIVANQAGMDVLGISSITNHAAGRSDEPLSHEEVLEVTEQVQDRLAGLVLDVLRQL